MRSYSNLGRRLFAVVGLLVVALIAAPITATSAAPLPGSASVATQQVATPQVATVAQVASVATAVMPAVSAAFVVPAVIDASYCAGIWTVAWWARACASDGNVYMQDLRQDGWSIELKYKNKYGYWVRYPYSTASYGKPVALKVSTALQLRVYRGNGNWFTLSWR